VTDLPAAVITSYRPGADLLRIVEAIAPQVHAVVIVDDGSGAAAHDVLEAAEVRGARVIQLGQNSGIAAALNHGIRAAFDLGVDAVVTFDQDSFPPEGFVAALSRARDQRRAAGRRSSPLVPEVFAGVRQAARFDRGGELPARGAIQSGMLVPRDVIDDVGMMREDLFIDLVDTEFELRCRAAGRPVMAVPGLSLGHALGARYIRRGPAIPGIPRVLTLSAPFRYYYRARNRVLIDRAYVRRFPLRIIRDSVIDRVYFRVVRSTAEPAAGMKEILREGRRAGRRGDGGRMPERLQAAAERVTWAAERVGD